MDGHRTCPYCAEEIHVAALRCPHCRSHLPAGDAQPWRRDHPDRRVAGVAVAAAHAFGVPVAAARVVFIVLTFIHFLGPLAYGALWLVIPFAPGEPSLFERGLRAARDLLTRLTGRWPVVPGGPLA